MADLVNMQQSEYDATHAGLMSLHESELAAIRDIVSDIKALAEYDGGFYVDRISAKINDLCGCLEGSVLAALEAAYDLTETTMETYMAAIVNIDTACG